MLPSFDLWKTGTVAADVLLASSTDAEGLAVRQRRRLAALLKAAATSSPRYRRLLKGRDPASLALQELPIARKAELMNDFERWIGSPDIHLDELRRFVADPARIGTAYLDRYVVWESSGTSGEPAVFVQDADAMAVYDALEALRRPVLRPLQHFFDPWGMSERIAFVGATSGHFASTVSIERLRRLNAAYRNRLFGLSFLQPLDRLLDELHARQPTIVATYPSAAVLLAEQHRAGRLRIRLNEVWTGGENLTPAMRQFVEESFGCPVASSYGASEFLSLASECREGSLHLNSDWAILESVDEHGIAVPAGELGATVLLTNLANHLQPLIRYDLGDRIAVHSAVCACGSKLPVIEVHGRDDDTLSLGARAVSILPLALTTVLEDDVGLYDFQLVQESPRRLCLQTSLSGPSVGPLLQRARSALEGFLLTQGATGVRIHCKSGIAAHCGRSGKMPRVIRRAVQPAPV
ncbi:MAG: AMP-binding protein [Caldimonas sp.]